MKQDPKRWLRAATDDLASARHLAEGGFHAPACFQAQQAAEKALKAVHYARGARSVMGHSIQALINKLSPRLSRLDALIGAAQKLDRDYIPSRYPNGLDFGTPAESFGTEDSERAIRDAAAILAAVTAEIHPS